MLSRELVFVCRQARGRQPSP